MPWKGRKVPNSHIDCQWLTMNQRAVLHYPLILNWLYSADIWFAKFFCWLSLSLLPLPRSQDLYGECSVFSFGQPTCLWWWRTKLLTVQQWTFRTQCRWFSTTPPLKQPLFLLMAPEVIRKWNLETYINSTASLDFILTTQNSHKRWWTVA